MAKRKPKKSRGKPLNSATGRQAAMKRWAARRAADTRTAPTAEIAAPGRPGGAGGEFQAEYGRLRAAGASDRDAVRGATLAQRRAQEVERQAQAAPSTAAGAAEERERVAREAQAAQLEQERLEALDQAHQDAIDENTERQRKAQEAIEHRQEEKVRLDAAAARRVSSTPGPAGPVRPENKQGAYRKADYVRPDGVYKVVLPPGHVPGRKKSL